MNMKWKIIIPMGCIMTALVITMLGFSTIRFTQYTGILFNERIAVSTNGMKRFLADSEHDTRIAAVSAANNIEVIAAIETRDRVEILRLLLSSIDLYHVDFFTVTDSAGTVLARTHAPEVFGDSALDQRNIREALINKAYTTIEEGTIVKIAVRTGIPVTNSSGGIVGVISAGVRLDTNERLDLLKEHYNADFSVFMDKKRVATTFFNNGVRILGTELDQDSAEQIYATKSEYFGVADILGENFSVFNLPLLDDHGEIFAVIAVGNSNSKLIAAKNTLQSSVIVIGTLGLVVSILILLFIISRIVRPVNRLEYLVSEVTHGNLDVDIDKTAVGKDEIGMLTVDIYSLIDVIKLILNDLSSLTIGLRDFGGVDQDHQINIEKYSGSYREIIDGIKKLADSISTMKKTMAIMDHLDTMISVCDFDYNLLYINQYLAKTYRIDRDDCIGKKCYKAIRNLDQPCPVCQMQKILPGRDSSPAIDYDNLYDESSGIYIGGKAAIIRWVDGAQVFFNSIKNETLKIEYQEQLRRAMIAAEEASVAKSAFLANMSHEIRTPMNSIIGFSELALDSEITPETREYVSMIKENAGWLLQIINDILDISKVESGTIVLEYIPFDLHKLLNSCKAIILPRANEKKIALEFHMESSVSKMLLGDPTRLRQVLINMLSNAVKFTNSGGVNLSVSVISETDNKISLHFMIEDTGIGMTGDQIKRIFEPFMQADISTTRKYGGTGLGMSIIKKTLDLMDSRLEINSKVGVGTKISFDLTLGTTDTDIKDSAAEAISITGKLNKPRFTGEILVCEDNLMNQRVVTEHLARVGLKAEIAENGQEGVDKVRSRIQKGMKPFDLIFMDIHMPVMDGIDAAKKIRELGTETPFVAMTANVLSDDRESYKTAGMLDYLGKPFTSQELWNCLLKYLKPSGFVDTEESKSGDSKLQTDLKTDFVEGNQTKFSEIFSAINSGDLKTAFRLAHSLKSSAAIIGRSALQKAAATVEAALRGGENHVTESQMGDLRTELAAALDDLSPYFSKKGSPVQPEPSGYFDRDKALALIEKLEPLLKSRNPECLEFADELKTIPGSGEVAQQMENYYFMEASKSLSELKLSITR